jgi:hypothetical protein
LELHQWPSKLDKNLQLSEAKHESDKQVIEKNVNKIRSEFDAKV